MQYLILAFEYLEISGNPKNTKKGSQFRSPIHTSDASNSGISIKLVVIKKELAIIKIDATTKYKLYLSLKNASLLLVLPIKEEIKNKIKLINGAAANNKTPD